MEDDDPPRASNLALILNTPTSLFKLIKSSFHSIIVFKFSYLKLNHIKVKVLWTRL